MKIIYNILINYFTPRNYESNDIHITDEDRLLYDFGLEFDF